MLAIAIIMAQSTLTSCGWKVGQGDKRDRNIGIATLNYLDSIPVEYIGLADTHDLEDGKFQAVVIFNVTDAAGNKTEHNARVTGETGACWDSMGVIKQCQDLHFRAGGQD